MKPVKTNAKLIEKNEILPTVLEVKFEIDNEIDFTPGQFAKIAVTPPYHRPYSIVSYKDKILQFTIEVRDPGKGADFFKNSEIGTETEIVAPMGRFTLKDNKNTKVFISTGTGIAPFVPMIKDLISQNFFNEKIYLFQGMKFREDDLPTYFLEDEFLNHKFNYVRCISRSDIANDTFERIGRVTSIVPRFHWSMDFTDFYICGGNHVVKDMIEVLEKLGAENIYKENWG